MSYWDSSALVKLYAREPDSPLFLAHLRAGVAIVTSQIGRLELWTTLCRKEATGDLGPGDAARALADFDTDSASGLLRVDALGPSVTRQFESTISRFYGARPAVPLRTLDAIHVATAITAGESQFVATDRRLRDVVIALGMSVFPPP
jgi:predicted nucleic acid-binding protein